MSDESPITKYILMLLYANKGKSKGKLWIKAELLELSKFFEDLKKEMECIQWKKKES